jgi:hypothetical protein
MPLASASPQAKGLLFVRSHRDLPPPVILLGMHRSGTSILSEMLRECGLFIGRELDSHYESPYFRRFNNELLSRAGSSWANPWAYLVRRADPAFHRSCRGWAERCLEGTFGAQFLGLKHRTSLFGGRTWAWGWKDPRTCLTMPVWNEIYPDARLVHITRHPLDVAISLQRREEQRRELGKRPQPENADLDHCLRLWETYVGESLKLREQRGRYSELRYEDLVRDPRGGLERIVEECYRPWRDRVAGLPSAVELGYE